MFDRGYLKEQSKQRMRGFRGNAIAVVLLTMLLGTLFSGGGDFNVNTDSETTNGSISETISESLREYITSDGSTAEEIEELLPYWGIGFAVVGAVLILALIIGIAYSIFVAGVIDVGCRGWFMRYWRGEYPSVGELFASFRLYLPAMKMMLLINVYTVLWTLLFLIPGIVKSYSYSLAPYIIYENPNLTANQAITLSRKLTDGAKGDLFVFDLSYIGWNLLNVFTFGILGIVYIYPYQCTAHAAIYDSLKVSAINDGRVTWADFGQLPPQQPIFDAPQA